MIHPCGELPVVAIRVPIFQHSLEYDLHNVFRGRAIVGELHQEAEQGAMVSLEKLAKRVELAVADGAHQDMIGALFDREFHRAKSCDRINHGSLRLRDLFRKTTISVRSYSMELAGLDLMVFEDGDHGSRA